MSGPGVSNARAWAESAAELAKQAQQEDAAIQAYALVSIALSLSVIAGVLEQCGAPQQRLVFPQVPDQSGEDPPPHEDDQRMREEDRAR